MLLEQGVCPFCPEHLTAYHDSPLLYVRSYWAVTANDYPYERTSLHLLFIPRRHLGGFDELTTRELLELLELVSDVVTNYDLTSYALTMRNGDPRYNGGSLGHFHIHLIVGDTSDPDSNPVTFKVSSRPSPVAQSEQ